MEKGYIDKPIKGEKERLQSSNLVFSINKDELVTKFNDKCEKISGFKKDEVINNSFFDFLVPNRYFSQWKDVVLSSLKNKIIDDFKLPILTKHGHEIMISWSSFPLKDKFGNVIDISFVGDLVSSWDDSSDSNQKPIRKIIKFNQNKNKEENNSHNIDQWKEVNEEISKQSLEDNTSKKINFWPINFFNRFKKAPDLKIKKDELEKRENDLKLLEDQIKNDKIEINRRINEFKTWRKKLENLENEIEKRRHVILKQEKILTEKATEIKNTDSENKNEEQLKNQKDIFAEISDSAFVLQRGILKQVNDAFVNLIGYSSDELVEKSYFDFIIPEGFSGLEEYYLHRLKGDDINKYNTAFLTKDNYKIFVEVNTRVIDMNGEKAEIAIVKKLNDSSINPKDEQIKQEDTKNLEEKNNQKSESEKITDTKKEINKKE